MKFEFDNEEATEIMETAIRAAIPVPAGYRIGSMIRKGTYSNATTVTLEKIETPAEEKTDV